jgi:benzodiazapine receptor
LKRTGTFSHHQIKKGPLVHYNNKRKDLSLGLTLYFAQLGLNCIWSPIFFGAHQVCLYHNNLGFSLNKFISVQPGIALADSVLLTGTTWYMTVSLFCCPFKSFIDFWQKILDGPTNGKATYFLLPYCAWLAYATYLNAGSWWLNRESDTAGK